MADMKKFEHLKIQLQAIKSATKNFAHESCIGKGGFGKVYKGKIGEQTMVALKRLDPKSEFGQGSREFWKEIMMLSLYKHENIVSLLGFCYDGGEKILVYEYVPNRSLDLNLNSDKLTWIGRLKICIGAAHGLAHLHDAVECQHRALHRDIKSSNILLDESWNAKISDFGLSKIGLANQEYTFCFSNAVGTPGYCDPLYAETGLLTKESDVYSFGVVLFEVLCGRLSIDNKNVKHPYLAQLARKSYEENKINEIVYGNIKNEINPDSLQVFTTIAYRCLKRNREERPLMSVIVRELEAALCHQELINDQVGNNYWISMATRSAGNGEYASEGGGLLVVTIHEGNDLKGKHPYIILRVGHDLRRTTTMKNNRNPVWKESSRFTLEKPAKAILHLVVRSDSWSRKDILGDVMYISLADVVREKHMDNIYNVGTGRIHVELQWEPSALPLNTKPKFLQFMSSVYKLSAGIKGE